MIEKHGALWVNPSISDTDSIVLESYVPEIEKLFVIYQQGDGLFIPFSFVKVDSGPQWSLPIWDSENDKALLSSLSDSKQYLSAYGLSQA